MPWCHSITIMPVPVNYRLEGNIWGLVVCILVTGNRYNTLCGDILRRKGIMPLMDCMLTQFNIRGLLRIEKAIPRYRLPGYCYYLLVVVVSNRFQRAR